MNTVFVIRRLLGCGRGWEKVSLWLQPLLGTAQSCEKGQECLSASAAIPTPCPHLSNLWEVAVGLGAATEALLVTQAVVEGRLHHMTCVDLVCRDVVLLCQAAHQVLRVAHELRQGRGY